MYEAFISFKNLDSNGRQTKDSEIAYSLYNMLSSLGIKTFFSNAEIQRKADPNWGDVIDSALREAKVIIVVGTRLEYVEAHWVKYEWRYFTNQINSGRHKKMLSVMEGFPLSDLPPAFAQVQNYPPEDLRLAADMVCGILGKERPKFARPEPKFTTTPSGRAPSYESGKATAVAETNGKNIKPIIITAVALVAAIILGIIILPKASCETPTPAPTETVSVETPAPTETVSFEKPEIDWSALKQNGSYTYGTYYYTEDMKGPINWKVLSIEGDRALMVTEQIIDVAKYNDSLTDVTWENCTLRKWLNEDFYNSAFSDSEKLRVLKTSLSTSKNAKQGTPGGNDTEDYVFCLSADETVLYFGEMKKTRFATFTPYAQRFGIGYNSDLSGYWWLRTPGKDFTYNVQINSMGSINYEGIPVDSWGVGIRPAFWMDISEA